jgi:hypothetical protein
MALRAGRAPESDWRADADPDDRPAIDGWATGLR